MADFEQDPQDQPEGLDDLIDFLTGVVEEIALPTEQEFFWQVMYPEVSFARITGDLCEDPDCKCGGKGRVVETVNFSSSLN